MLKSTKKVIGAVCAMFFVAAMAMGPLSNEAEAFGAVKKISITACYNQETGQQSGASNNCVMGDGSCIDNGCGPGQAEGKLVIIDAGG